MADLTITESDAVESTSVTESVTAEVSDLYISVNDTTAVTDVGAVGLPFEIFQYESVYVTEWILGITGLALDDGVLSDLQIDAAMGVNLWVDPPDIIRTVDGVYGWLPDLQIDAAMDVRTGNALVMTAL